MKRPATRAEQADTGRGELWAAACGRRPGLETFCRPPRPPPTQRDDRLRRLRRRPDVVRAGGGPRGAGAELGGAAPARPRAGAAGQARRAARRVHARGAAAAGERARHGGVAAGRRGGQLHALRRGVLLLHAQAPLPPVRPDLLRQVLRVEGAAAGQLGDGARGARLRPPVLRAAGDRPAQAAARVPEVLRPAAADAGAPRRRNSPRNSVCAQFSDGPPPSLRGSPSSRRRSRRRSSSPTSPRRRSPSGR